MRAGDGCGLDSFPEVQTEIEKCMRCGFCMSACPVYSVEKSEGGVARGKIGIAEAVLNGDLELDEREVIETLYDCLVCKSCMQVCPSGVQFDRIILGLRAAIARKNGLPWVNSALFAALKEPSAMDAGMKVMSAIERLVFRNHPDLRAVSPRSPFAILGNTAGFDGNRLLPSPASVPLRDQVGESIPVDRPVARAAFFTGCSLHYFYPSTGIDLIEVLTANRVEVTVPKQQQCCGTPVLVHGDRETARTLARNNIDAMDRSGAEYIVTGCGSCGGAWQHQFPEILQEEGKYAERASYWSARTYDVSTFLTFILHFRPPMGRVDTVVTYHDSCHLKKSMKVFREPREILRSIPGVTLQEMKQPDACCGSGGSYALTHPETGDELARRKAADAASTGASAIATGCPACMMQLLDSTQRFGAKQDVTHYISLLAESYRRDGGRP